MKVPVSLAGVEYKVGWPEPYIYRYIRCTYGIVSRETTIHTVKYGAGIRFWPTLNIKWISTPVCFLMLPSELRHHHPDTPNLLFSFIAVQAA
jgi:hypothetical protein